MPNNFFSTNSFSQQPTIQLHFRAQDDIIPPLPSQVTEDGLTAQTGFLCGIGTITSIKFAYH